MMLAIVSYCALNQPSEWTAPLLDLAPPTAVASAIEPEPVLAIPRAQEEKKDAHFSYTFVELGGTSVNPDDTSVTNDNVDSYYLRGSLGLGMFYLFGGYENQQLDFMDTKGDLYTLGAGIHFGAMPKLDFIGEAAWLYNDVSSDLAGLDDSASGFEGRVGARWMPLLWDGGGLELDGNVVYVDLSNRLGSDSYVTGWEAGARLHFLRLFSVGAMYGMLGQDDEVNLNARVSF